MRFRHVARVCLASRGRQPVDRLRVAEVDLPVRRRLHRVDRAPRGVQHVDRRCPTRRLGRRSARPDAARRCSRRRRTVALRPGSQAAAVAERVAGDADRSRRTRASGAAAASDRCCSCSPASSRRRSRSVPIRSCRRATIRLISSLHSGPFSVSHRLSVCGSNVKPNELRMPNAKIEAARDRVVRRHAAGRRHAQDLPAEVAPEVLGVRAVVAVADDRVEHAVRSEQDAPAVVVRARARGLRHQDPHRARVRSTRVIFRIWFLRPLPVERVT